MNLIKTISLALVFIFFLESLLRYLLSNLENMTGEKLKTIVAESITGKEGGVIMEYANSALGKEFHKGMHQGLAQGLKETA